MASRLMLAGGTLAACGYVLSSDGFGERRGGRIP
jgi:hypothetical protein